MNVDLEIFWAGRVMPEFARQVSQKTVDYMFWKCKYHRWPKWLQRKSARWWLRRILTHCIEEAVLFVVKNEGFVIYRKAADGQMHPASRN